MYKAEWMVQSGKTSEDFDNLPISDVKLICSYLAVKNRRTKNLFSAAIMEALGGAKR